MKPIAISSVKVWAQQNGLFVPGSVSIVCPHCGEKGTLTLGNPSHDTQRNTWASSGPCPTCSTSVHFWTINPKKVTDRQGQDPDALFMYPPQKAYHESMTFTENIPAALQRSFISTVDAFNAKNYTATAVCCGRTLEGIFKYLVPEDKRGLTLARLIEEAKTTVDLTKPLTNLSHAIREGRNLGAHFDMAKEPDPAMAKQMVELLEYLLEYLYVLPKQIDDLEEILGKES